MMYYYKLSYQYVADVKFVKLPINASLLWPVLVFAG